MINVTNPELLAQLKSLSELLSIIKYVIAAGGAAYAFMMIWLRRIIRKEAEKSVYKATSKIETGLFNLQKRVVRNGIDASDRINQIRKDLNDYGNRIAAAMESGKTVSDENAKKYEIALNAFRELLKKSEASRQKDLQEFQKVIIDRYKDRED